MWSPPLHLLSLCCSQLQALPGCTLCWGQGAAAGDSRGGHGGSRQGTRCCRCLGGRGHEGDRGSWSLLSPLGPQSWLSRGQSRQAQRCGDTARNAATGPPVWSLFGPLPALVGLGGGVPVAPLSRLWSPPAVCHPPPGWEARGPLGTGTRPARRKRGAGSRARGKGGGCTAPRAHAGQTLAVPRPHPPPGKGSSP